MLMLQCRNRRFCAGFRTPAALSSPRAPPAGVRKAPRHEIASGGSGPSVPQEGGAANGYGDLVAGPDLRRSASANRLEQGCNLDVPARMLLNGDFTFCPIRNFRAYTGNGGTRDSFCAISFMTSFGPQHKGS